MPRSEASFGGHAFADAALLQQALTHRSAGAAHNERLEFLGDAVIGALMAEALFQHFPRADEGALTRTRAELVRESSLAQIARELDVGAHLVLGPGELKSGGHRRDSILSDALEAVIGAIYLDAGFDACRGVVLPWFDAAIARIPGGNAGKDAKTRLQERLQARGRALPVYELIDESGEEHAKSFVARCRIEQPALETQGQGSSRRAAEQDAAEAMLAQLDALRRDA